MGYMRAGRLMFTAIGVCGAVAPAVASSWGVSPMRAVQAITAPGWQVEAIPAARVIEPVGLSFDAVGHAMVTWEGSCGSSCGGKEPPVEAGVREPAGGWHQVPNPPIQSSDARTYLYGNGLAQQIGSVVVGSRFQVLAADGTIRGNFATPQVLDANGEQAVSVADTAGDAIVAWRHAMGRGGTRIAERTHGHPFSTPRTFAGTGFPLAMALGARGDRVLVWPSRAALYTRIRRPGGQWGSPHVAVRLPRGAGAPLVSAAINPSGTVVLAWEASAGGCEFCPYPLRAGVAESNGASWNTFTIERPVAASHLNLSARIVTLVDTAGGTYVVWNGVSHGAAAVKLARVGKHGMGATTVVSAGVRPATLAGAAAGPRSALAVSWISTTMTIAPAHVYVSVSRGGLAFAAPTQVASGSLHAGSGLVAFQPITGQPVVVSDVAGALQPLQAAVGPPG